MENFFVFVASMLIVVLLGFFFRLGWELGADLMYAVRVRFRRPKYDARFDCGPQCDSDE